MEGGRKFFICEIKIVSEKLFGLNADNFSETVGELKRRGYAREKLTESYKRGKRGLSIHGGAEFTAFPGKAEHPKTAVILPQPMLST